MVSLAALVFLPRWGIAAVALVMIAGHNLLDPLSATQFGALDWLWIILHKGGTIQVTPDFRLFVLYPLIPWIGVMAAGYALGLLLLRPAAERRRWFIALGLGLILLFILLRWTNLYGDPQPWAPQRNALMTLLSFVNTTKYPASLLFLAMTLGPTLLLLAVFDRLQEPGLLARPLLILGRVPLLYYIVHMMVIHGMAVLFSYLRYGQAPWLFGTGWADPSQLPRGYGYELPVVYLVWLAVVVLVYPLCYWFAGLKRRHRWWWLSYL